MAINNRSDFKIQLAEIDKLSANEAHQLFTNTNPSALTEALYSLNRGDLKEISAIHKVAKNVLDQNIRQESKIFQTIQQFPDLLSIDKVLPLNEFHILQRYASKLPFLPNKEERACFFETANCQLSKRGIVKVTNVSNLRNAPWHIVEIIENLCKKALESAYKLDGEFAKNQYQAHIFIARDNKSNNYPLKDGLALHHDYDYNEDGSPAARPKYLFLSILSDRDGDGGWNGGNLVIQNDVSNYSKFVPFKKDKPHLIYEYPLNQAICLRNREVAHGMTGLKSRKSPESEELSRDLILIQIYENQE